MRLFRIISIAIGRKFLRRKGGAALDEGQGGSRTNFYKKRDDIFNASEKISQIPEVCELLAISDTYIGNGSGEIALSILSIVYELEFQDKDRLLAYLRSQYQLESLAVTEILMAVEDFFDVEIPDSAFLENTEFPRNRILHFTEIVFKRLE